MPSPAPSLQWTAYVPSARDEIIHRVQIGELLPQEAELEAAKNGVGPLATAPPDEKFDPMREAWWTLPMTAAWIIWRQPIKVMRAWHEYRREVWHWIGPVTHTVSAEESQSEEAALMRLYEGKPPRTRTFTGYFLERARELSLFDTLMRSAIPRPDDPPLVLPGAVAQIDLWRKLQSGELVAEGIRTGQRERAPIRDSEWIDLDFEGRANWPSDAIGLNSEKQPRYESVRVRSARVIALWPVIGEVPSEFRTGAPGRPSSKQLVIAEARRRLETNDRPELFADFAEGLAEWLAAAHPTFPQMRPRTIENALRGDWNTARK